MDDFANVVGATEESTDLGLKADDKDLDQDDDRLPSGAPRILQRFTIVGYTPGAPFTRLVLAQETPGSLVYVGMLIQGLGPAQKEMIYRKLTLTERSPLGGLTNVEARWVEPKLSCEVEYTYINSAGLIEDATFKGL